MAELRAFFVNSSKIPDEPLEVVFAYHCATGHKMATYGICDSDGILGMVKWRAFFIEKKVNTKLGPIFNNISFGTKMVIDSILMRKACK